MWLKGRRVRVRLCGDKLLVLLPANGNTISRPLTVPTVTFHHTQKGLPGLASMNHPFKFIKIKSAKLICINLCYIILGVILFPVMLHI